VAGAAYAATVRTLLLTVLVLAGCKDKQPTKVEPHVSAFPTLPGAAPVVDPADKPAFPQEPPVVVVWRGGGESPKTELGVRVWRDGTVRYTCGRRATVATDRVAAMLAAFTAAGWNPAAAKEPVAADPACTTTSVQLQLDGKTERRNSGCGTVPYEIQDAVDFVQSVVGPGPC
jgi:hypothetical protein